MDYSKLVETYEKLEKTTKRLEKTYIISELLKKTPEEDLDHIIYLIQGNVFPRWDERKIGMSSRSILKAISESTGVSAERIEKEWAKKGDLGIVVEELLKTRKQTTLFSRKLTTEKVFENLRKLAELEGHGTVSRKVTLIVELITSASPVEARFIVRTVLEKLRINVAEGIIRDSIVWAYFPKVLGLFFKCEKCKNVVPHFSRCASCGKNVEIKFKDIIKKKYQKVLKVKKVDDVKRVVLKEYDFVLVEDEKLAREVYNHFVDVVQNAYNLTNDLGQVARSAKRFEFSRLGMKIGVPLNPMLAIKAEDAKEAFESVGKPALVEYKFDGFRLQIHKDSNQVKLFTRRLENVTKQFKELIPIIKSHVKAKSFIIDSEVIGYDVKTGKYLPFQHISQRIRRKYDIEKMSKEVPVEINVFDIMYKDGKSLFSLNQKERRKILERIIKEEKNKIKLTDKFVTDDERELEKFYKKSLKKGNEGVMVKSLNSVYVPGRRVGGWVKIKPVKESLDLVITSADWGEGKRAKWLSSFTLSCRDGNNFLEIGKVGTGILEKGGELTFESLTKMLKPLIKSEKGKKVDVKAKVIVEVAYEEIQNSPTYSSGFALRFPRVVRLRDDLGVDGVDNLVRIKKFFEQYKK
jgi:ATP-dependent DNA ligase I